MRAFLLAVVALIALTTGRAEACPDYTIWGAERYQATGAQLFSRADFEVVAGGRNYIFNCRNVQPGTDRGAGYFTTQPDFSFELSGMGSYQLVISVVSQCDSALLINTGNVNWFYDDDDNGNLDPRIVLTRPSNGIIDIWVGTYDGDYCDAILSLETFSR